MTVFETLMVTFGFATLLLSIITIKK
ncbi:putative holin-like toxin [Pradoshia sp.]